MNNKSRQDDKQAVRKAEQVLYKAMVDRDIEAPGDLLAEDLEYCHSTAVAEDTTLFLSRVENGHHDYRSVESEAVMLRVDGDLAAMNGHMRMSVATGGGPVMDMRLIFVLIWTRSDGAWRLSLPQSTNKRTAS